MQADVEDAELERLADGSVIEAALREAVRDVLRRHKLLGNPAAEWRDGRVVWIPPEDILIDDAVPPPRREQSVTK